MPLMKQKFSILLSQGVQEKVDQKVLPSEYLAELKNGTHNKLGRISKRNGYTLIDKKGTDLISYRGQLVARNASLHRHDVTVNNKTAGAVYSEGQGDFISGKGFSEGVGYTYLPVSSSVDVCQMDPNTAFSSDGKYACITYVSAVWDQSGTAGVAYIKKASIVDRSTNALIASDLKIGNTAFSGNNGRRMVPLWVGGKFFIWAEDELELRGFSIDPTVDPIVVRNYAGAIVESSTTGTQIVADANYPLTVGAKTALPYKVPLAYPSSDESYETRESGEAERPTSSFDVADGSDPDKAHLVVKENNGGAWNIRHYEFDASGTPSHTAKFWDATATTLGGHIAVHRSKCAGNTTKLLSATPHVGVGGDGQIRIARYLETYATPDYVSVVTTASEQVRAVFADQQTPFTGGAADVDLYYEDGSDEKSYGGVEQNETNGQFLVKRATGILAASASATISPDTLSHKARLLFATGNTGGSGPTIKGCHLDRTPSNPGAAAGRSTSYDDFLTPVLWGEDMTASTVWPPTERDHLPVGSFNPRFVTGLVAAGEYLGSTEALKGHGVSVPLVSAFHNWGDAKGTNQLPGSIINFFDFRRVNERQLTTASPSSALLNDVLFVADNGLFAYDGDQFLPVGLHDRPTFSVQQITPTETTTLSGEYQYALVYEWEDAAGNLYQSQVSNVVPSGTLGGGKAFEVRVNDLSIPTGRTALRAVIYRTDSAGTIFREVSSVSLGDNSSDSGTYLFEDNTASPSGKFLYSDSGELQNMPPPASARYVIAHSNRLFVIGKDDAIWYSKLAVDGFGIGFHLALSIKTPGNKTDRPTALGSMDGNLFIFTENSVYYVGGEGPDNLGAGSFYEPKKLPASCGAVEGSPVRLTGDGLLFVSKKGIMLLGRGYEVQYIGAAVEDLLGTDTVKDIVIDQEKEVVYFLTSAVTPTLLTYNYRTKQWGHDIIGGTYAIDSMALHEGSLYLSTILQIPATSLYFGQIYKQSTGFADNTTHVPLTMKTAWINLAGIQGYQRVYSFHLLGEAKANHKLTVTVRYDYTTSLSGTDYEVETTSAGTLQFRAHLTKQKCQAIQFEITETASSGVADTEGYTISEIALEVGLKTDQYKNGLMKLSSTSTVGSTT